MNKNLLNQYIESAKKYVKKEADLFVGFGVMGLVVLAVLVGVLIYQSAQPNIVYQPVSACNLFTPQKAQKLFNEDVHRVDRDRPTIADETATSKCSYTKLEQARTDTENLVVAAIAVRSGINDEGKAKNQADFATAQQEQKGEVVEELEQKAFYTPERGQLNILDGRKWIILSYGNGNDPSSNKLDDVLKLADTVLEN